MRFSLPSHPAKFLTAIGIAIVIILATAITVIGSNNNSSSKKTDSQENEGGLSILSASSQTAPDSDNDGLADWQEALRKTDPNNPDTDGDGTNDGDEIRDSRNPLIAGPDDKVEQARSSEPNKPASYIPESGLKPKTLTSRSAISLFQAFVKSGGSLDPSVAIELGQSVSNLTTPKTYSVSNIKTVSSSRENKIIYADSMLEIIAELRTNRGGASSADSNSGLTVDIRAHSIALSRLQKVSVPEDAIKTHLDFMNGISGIINLMRALLETDDDPLSSVLIIGSRQDEVDQYDTALENINNYILSVSNTI